MKKRIWGLWAGAAVVCIGAFLALTMEIGVPKAKLVQDLYRSQQISEEWDTVGVASHEMAAYLSYPDTEEEPVWSVYVNRPGLSFGWFFRGGGTLSAVERGILEVHLPQGQQHAFLSMNRMGVVRVDIDNGSKVETVDLPADQPFVLVLPTKLASVTFYTVDGTVVEPTPYQL